MSQYIKQGNIFGRIGSGIGQGLAEQIPEEIKYQQLKSGLEKFEQEAPNMSPMQQAIKAAGIRHISPHQTQLISDAAKNEARLRALGVGTSPQGQQPESQKTIPQQPININVPEKPGEPVNPSVTTREPVNATLRPQAERTLPEIDQLASQLIANNPAKYAHNPEQARSDAIEQDRREISQNQTLQQQRKNEQDVEKTLKSEIDSRKETANIKIPDNKYREIVDKAMDEIANGDKTEKQAGADAAKELDKVSREYQDLYTIGGMGMMNNSPAANRRTIKATRQDFKERNDLENFADTLVETNGLSYPKAYSEAYPVEENKELNSAIKSLGNKVKIGNIIPVANLIPGIRNVAIFPRKDQEKTFKKLSSLMTKEDSFLAVGEKLRGAGYDPNEWMAYGDKNRKQLDVSERQAREFRKNFNFLPTLNDLYLEINWGQ